MNTFNKILLTIGLSVLPLNLYAQTSAEEIEKILLENPEILEKILKKNKEVLNDAVIEILQDNKVLLIDIIQQGADSKRKQQLQSQWEQDLKIPKDPNLKDRPTRGDENAPITLVAFSDFACSYCMQAASTIENLLAKYPNQIRFVFKQFVSDSPAAQEAARWFLAAIAQDHEKGWNFYAMLFSNQPDFFANPTATLKAVAGQVGLNVKALEADIKKNQKKYNQIIEEDIADAKKLGFTGTPYFLVNDLIIRGALPLESFIDAYEFALKNSK